MSKSDAHDYRLDLIRSIAIFGTITIHSVHEIFARTDYAGGMTWWLANALNSFSKVSIPFFIMLSGALLFNRLDTFSGAADRVRRRLLFPLIFWVLVYRLIDTFWFNKPFDPIGLYHLALNGNVFVFYFMVILAGAYLVTPFFKSYEGAKSSPSFLRQSMVGLFFIGVLFTISAYILGVEHSWWNSTTMWLPYYGYFIAGHLLYRTSMSKQIPTRALLGAAGAAGAALALANYANSRLVAQGIYTFWHAQGFGVQYFDEYLNPFVIVLSLALFAWLLRTFSVSMVAHGTLTKITSSISGLSFGMYAIHSFVLQLLEHRFFMTTGNASLSLLALLLGKLIITFTASWMLSYGLSKIPYSGVFTGISKQST